MPTIEDARNALRFGDEIGSGAYRSVLRRPGDFWCYKIPSLIHYEYNPSLNKYIGDESLDNWMKESNLSTEVEYFNYKRIVKDWGDTLRNDTNFTTPIRIPKMQILRGKVNGRMCRVIAAQYYDVVEKTDLTKKPVIDAFAQRYSLKDMHSDNIKTDAASGELVALDLGEDTWHWSGQEEGGPCYVELKDYRRYLRYGA